MRIETIALLRCPAAHASSPLVTVAIRRDGDRLIEATLGCSVCGAEYAVRDGVAWLTGEGGAALPVAQAASVDPVRVAALLALGDPGARALLCGTYGAAAGAIEDATGAQCIVVNAPSVVGADTRFDQLVIGNVSSLPLANASLDGLAVDFAHAALLADAPRVVRAGGRVVAPAQVPVPDGCKELARDEQEWVAGVDVPISAPIALARPAR
ncbi:MAG: hypothetical protein IPP90_00045 [Gemmatimonadaceae bacterium]|nr:hypothetical protein [Gemmatimonadaceae bacterium]